MGYVFEAILFITCGVLFAAYSAAFLTPKTGKPGLTSVVFGCAYVAVRYIVEYLTAGYIPEPVLALLKTTIMSAVMFGLSFAFYRKEPGKQVFLLLSFFTVLDVCLLITAYIGVTALDVGWMLYGESLAQSAAAAPENASIYTRLIEGFSYVLNYLLFTILASLSLKSIAKSFTYKKHTLKTAEILAVTLPCFSTLAITHAMRMLLFSANTGGAYIITGASGLLVTASSGFLLLTLIASVKLFQKSILLHMEGMTTAILREQIKQIENQSSSGIYEELRGMRHDLKNHFANITLLLKSAADKNPDAMNELGDYVGKMGETLETLDFVYDTGNPVSDVVIHQRYLEAKRKHISFSSNFAYPAGVGIEPYDIAVILSNALDNAFEACGNVTENERFVILSSRIKGEFFFIEVSNSYCGRLNMDNKTGLPVSSKTDGAEHGLGLSNIRRFALKYLGGIDINLSEQDDLKTFHLAIMLQGAPPH